MHEQFAGIALHRITKSVRACSSVCMVIMYQNDATMMIAIKISARHLISALLLIGHLRCSYASLRGSDDGNRSEESSLRILQEAQDALFLLKVTEHKVNHSALGLGINTAVMMGGAEHRRKRTQSIQLPDGTIYQVKNARAGWASHLNSGNDHVHVPSGAIISSSGTIDMKGETLILLDSIGQEVKSIFDRNLEAENSNTTKRRRQLQSSSIGTRTVLVVRVILENAMYNYADPIGLSNDVFGNGVDSNNLKSQFAACSSNQLLFEKSPDRLMTSNPNDGGTTDIHNGVVDVKVDLNRSAGDDAIRNAVTIKLNAVFGVGSPIELADHVMYCLPPGAMPEIAYAYINSWNSVFSNEWCNYVSAQMHEVSFDVGGSIEHISLSVFETQATTSHPVSLISCVDWPQPWLWAFE